MNVLMMSPHFPENFYHFCTALHHTGATVLGMADAEYAHLRPELREVLCEYYKVQDMHNYDELIRAVGYFTYKHGKIDRIESHNEYWLETDARLRTDFNVFGIHAHDIEFMKSKSKMKKRFLGAGIPVARGRVVHSPEDALRLIHEVGYPVVAKPDKGVGAANTYKIHHAEELHRFFDEKPAVDYIIEEFIRGQVYSFDGLTDRHGNIVFSTCHIFNHGIMEIVNHDLNISYYSLRTMPETLYNYGTRIIDAFDIKERFFHLEFFKVDEDQFVALEVNMRPPGGLTLDMFNYAADIDLYQEWANLIVHDTFLSKAYQRKYHVAYIGRKQNRNYTHSHDAILRSYHDLIVHHQAISGIFGPALGNYGYVVRSPELTKIFDAIDYIHHTEGERT